MKNQIINKMFNNLKFKALVIVFALITLIGCRTEETEIIDPPAQEALAPNSLVATLMQRTATNDGSYDNIVDNASCFNIEFPFTVIVNGEEITVNDEDDLDDIEDILDEFDDDIDEIVIEFPIIIILADFTEVEINSLDELEDFADECGDENELDDDIECLDFQYPITASVFNPNNELIDTITINNDEELYEFIDDIDEDDIVTLDFPITVILFDGTTQTVNSLSELQAVIENADGTCDEDDDNDYNDDDCDNCTVQGVTDFITACPTWFIDDLEINDVEYDEQYMDFLFTFNLDGTIVADDGTDVYNGTWTASGEGNNIEFVIDIPGLDEVNGTWFVHELEMEIDEYKFELRLGDDELEFESECI